MRKLLILTVVLGMASMANAGLSLVVGGVEVGDEITIAPTDSIWIGVYDDAGEKFIGYVGIAEESLGVAEAGGSWTGGNNVYLPPAQPGTFTSNLGYYTSYGDVWYLSNADATTNVPAIGLQADYEFHCDVLYDDVVINLMVDASTILDTLTIHQIPEPITMVLLGLGGLFLRRRK